MIPKIIFLFIFRITAFSGLRQFRIVPHKDAVTIIIYRFIRMNKFTDDNSLDYIESFHLSVFNVIIRFAPAEPVKHFPPCITKPEERCAILELNIMWICF